MKNIKLWIAICIIIFVSGIIGSIFILNKPHGTVVNIIQDGKIIRTIDLDSAENQTFTVEFDGKENTIEISEHQIRMLDADCPDHVCVNTGWLKSNAMPIVCLPNKLTIQFADNDSGLDAVV
ncbi:NusG domain II-containing protein [Ruminococcus sp. 25CYCFAH16]